MIHLLDIDPGNWRIGLAVSEAQKPFVSDRAKLLARAYAYRARRSRAFLICADDLPVGMGLYYDEPELQSYDRDRHAAAAQSLPCVKGGGAAHNAVTEGLPCSISITKNWCLLPKSCGRK